MTLRKKIILFDLLLLSTGILVFFYLNNNKILGGLFYFSYLFLILFSNQLFLKQRKKQIKKMWTMVDELNLTTENISQLSGIGRLDLECSKQDQGGYLLSQSEVRKIISELENKKIS